MSEVKFSVAIKTDTYKNLINNTLGDKEIARNFIANISTVVANNSALQKCEPSTIISAGLMAESLKLSTAQSLGYCYIIPYGNKAQFMIGAKGFIQLAQRSGQYKAIGVKEVHKSEYQGMNEFGEEMFKFSHDYDNEEIVGYMAYFELLNGFRKVFYMTKKQLEQHGQRYSKSYNKLWTSDFDTMAKKTVVKLLLSKWGVLSIELQKAVQADQAVINGDKYEYVDNPNSDEEDTKLFEEIINKKRNDKPVENTIIENDEGPF